MVEPATRDRIVEAAGRLFYRQGFVHTSFSDIAGAVQIARGNFHCFFPTEDKILAAVIDLRLANTRRMLEQWETEGGNPAGRKRLSRRRLHPARSETDVRLAEFMRAGPGTGTTSVRLPIPTDPPTYSDGIQPPVPGYPPSCGVPR